MKIDYEALELANRLVAEMGEMAVRMSRVKLVELTAANDVRAAEFWRQVMREAEKLLAGPQASETSSPSSTISLPAGPLPVGR